MKLQAIAASVLLLASFTQTHGHNLPPLPDDTYSTGQFQQQGEKEFEYTHDFIQQDDSQENGDDGDARNLPFLQGDTYSFGQFQQQGEKGFDDMPTLIQQDGSQEGNGDDDDSEKFVGGGGQLDDGADNVFNDVTLQLFNVPSVQEEFDDDDDNEDMMTRHFSPPGKRQVEDEPASPPRGDEGDSYEDAGEDGQAVVQWNNKYHQRLQVVCQAGFGLFVMRSHFDRGAGDRLFTFQCKRIAPTTSCVSGYNPNARRCQWAKINTVGMAGSYQCPANYYLAGVQSRPTCKHDREWFLLCCNTPHICHNTCAWTGYLNRFTQAINFHTGGVFTGMISVYNAGLRDRQYRLKHCSMKMC